MTWKQEGEERWAERDCFPVRILQVVEKEIGYSVRLRELRHGFVYDEEVLCRAPAFSEAYEDALDWLDEHDS